MGGTASGIARLETIAQAWGIYPLSTGGSQAAGLLGNILPPTPLRYRESFSPSPKFTDYQKVWRVMSYEV